MPTAVAIEVATPLDAAAISRLINGLSMHFTQDPQGTEAEAFLKTIGPAGIVALMEAPNMLYCKAVVGGQLAGVVALRDNTHLFHLFVDPAFQRQGLSRKLWLHVKTIALSKGHGGSFTVNSTPSAVPVYRRFGFVATGPQVDKNGISFVPMRST
jgi:GNAT superfamily N-acetyltransferase